MELTSAQRRQLKAMAQRLEPVLRIGKAGLSDAFLKSVHEAFASHELLKIKFAEFKENKRELAPLLAEKTGSCLVTRVGNVVVLYREHPNPARRQIQF
jgi:RNA-binding protein